MPTPLTAVKREALFIKASDLGPSLTKAIIKRYTFNFFDDKACDSCEFRIERETGEGEIGDLCQNCASFKGSYQLASKVKVKDTSYVKVPVGDFPRFKAFLVNKGRDIKVRSLSPKTKIKPIKFTGTLRDYQKKAVAVLIEGLRGILKSLPRSGKTVMASAMVCELGYKTLILASQRDWLVGFHETFVGSKTQKPLTDLEASRIGFARKYEDFVKYDICLVTVQTFWSEKGQALLRRIRDMFPVLIIDEIQTSAADKYLMVMSRMNVRYSIGLSGTPSRKDCVARGTLVTMADGSKKPIELVAVGDWVRTVNSITGEIRSKPVLETHVRPPQKLVRVSAGDSSLKGTPDHEFGCGESLTWIKAKELTQKCRVLTED